MPYSPAPQLFSANNVGDILRSARLEAGLSLRDLARRAGTSHATLSAYEQSRKTPSVATFLKILSAGSFAADLTLRPRIRQRNGMTRGEELAQVLELAEQFPSQPAKTLPYPRFGEPA